MRMPVCVLVISICSGLAGCCPKDKADQVSSAPEQEPAEKPPASASVPVASVVQIQAPLGPGGESVTVARYETRFRDPLIEKIRKRDEAFVETRDLDTSSVRARQAERKEQERLAEKFLHSSLPAGQAPSSPADFKQVPHQPPVPQHHTGTCWAFATTSLLEAEAERINKRRIKLSEMATVYYEYLAKAERVFAERGDSQFEQGSQAAAVLRMWKRSGAWPLEAFKGVVAEDGLHDHIRLHREMKALLDALAAVDMWDSAAGLSMVRVLLDRHLSRPPASFVHEGRKLDPQAFMGEVLNIDPDAYVSCMSSLAEPFWTKATFDVPDNWWKDASYYNLPLDDFYGAIKGAIAAGFSLVIAVDVSEPGKDGPGDVMFVPDYDIPADRIDQLAREYRIAHKLTTDDHGVHLVGYTEHAGHDWFLVKDSGRSARRGVHKGYYFVRGDYVRLKVLAFTVHRDAVADLLKKFPG
jgi:bleomycin hydrolase